MKMEVMIVGLTCLFLLSSCFKSSKDAEQDGAQDGAVRQEQSLNIEDGPQAQSESKVVKAEPKLKSDPQARLKISDIFRAQSRSTDFAADGKDPVQYNFEGSKISPQWKWFGPQPLALSPEHYVSGRQSLKVHFEEGSKLLLNHKIERIEKTWSVLKRPGVNVFMAYVYSPSPQAHLKLKCEMMNQDMNPSGAYQSMRLNFKGWRTFYFSYERDTSGDCPLKMAGLQFTVEGGDHVIFMDQVSPWLVSDARHQWSDAHVQGVKGRDLPVDREWKQRIRWKGEQLNHGVESLATVESRLDQWCLKPGPDFARLAKTCARLGFAMNGDAKSARPIRMKVQLVLLDHIKKQCDERLIKDMVLFRSYQEVMYKVACLYRQTRIEEVKSWARQMYLGMTRHLVDQGYAQGSAQGTTHHWGYSSREWYLSCFLMRSVLAQEGLKGQIQKALKYYMREYPPTALDENIPDASNMDYMNTISVSQLISILLLEDVSERSLVLVSFSDFYSAILSRNSPGSEDGFKKDGCLFRHHGHYPGYGFPALSGACELVSLFRGTPFGIQPKGLLKLKDVMIKATQYSHPRVSLALSGRHPFEGPSLEKLARGFVDLAHCFEPVDEELLAHARRLKRNYGYSMAGAEEDSLDLERGDVASDPDGFFAFNHGAFGTYWTDGVMVTFKGYNTDVWSSEIYTRDNRYGRYQSHGSFQVQRSSGFNAEGHLQDGWDWNRNPGASTVHLPLELLNSPRKNTTMDKSSSRMAGAIGHGRSGLFAMKLREGNLPNYSSMMRARKSYFCIDGRVVALGDGIGNARDAFETETTLFQVSKSLGYPEFNGEKLQSSGERVVQAGDVLASPSGEKFVFLESMIIGFHVGLQNSRHNKSMEKTQAAFSVAWIKHGKAPSAGRYGYVLFPKSSDEEVLAWASTLKNKQSQLQVLSQDRYAHVMKDLSSGLVAMAIFKSLREPIGSIVEISRGVLAMVEENPSELSMSLVHPDLNWDEHGISQAHEVKVLLDGVWQLHRDVHGVRRVVKDGQTELTVLLKDGLSSRVSLVKP